MKENKNNSSNYNISFEKQYSECQKTIEKILFGDYLQWLEQFTLKYPNFTDIEWEYFNEKVSETDYKNIVNLRLLYEIIAIYSQENYSARSQVYINYFIVRNNNFTFQIGNIQDDSSIIYIIKDNVSNQFMTKCSIDLEDIREKYKQGQKSDKLIQLIKNLINKNSSQESTPNETHKVLSKQIDSNHKL